MYEHVQYLGIASHSLYPNTPRPLPFGSCFFRRTATLQGSSKQQGQRSLKAGGLAYQIDFSAADPSIYVPDIPFPETTSRIWGQGEGESIKSIPRAQFNDGSKDVKVESLMPENLYLGQIVPFEFKITVEGLEAPEEGTMQFTAGWSTTTRNGDSFGYDGDIGVLAAFVDKSDGAHYDPEGDATVTLYNSRVIGDEIQGVINLTGLDEGDVVVVEVWLVLQTMWPSGGATGNVGSRLIDAKTAQNSPINTGEQTVPLFSGDIALPPAGYRLTYSSWLKNYDSSYRPTLNASEDEDDIHLFCG
jgi:hypothetical protein